MNLNIDIETFFNTQNIKRSYMPSEFFLGPGTRWNVIDAINKADASLFFVDNFFANDSFIKHIQGEFPKTQFVFIKEEPRTNVIDEIIAEGTKFDLVLCLGGGSTIDAGKALISAQYYGTYDGVGYGQLRGAKPKSGQKKPIFICLPTTAGTGADVSRYLVLYRSDNKHKITGRSWRLIADRVLLDPYFLEKMPPALLVSCAFDAFTHLFESYVLRYERSFYNDMLAVDGVQRIVKALRDIVLEGKKQEDQLVNLMWASTLGGIAISNVRTGNIHEAAGILLEESTLTHPETLFVYAANAIEQYHSVILDREKQLCEPLQKYGINNLKDLMGFFDHLFEKTGIKDNIKIKMEKVKEKKKLIEERTLERVLSDTVWVQKESPMSYSKELAEELIKKSLNQWLP